MADLPSLWTWFEEFLHRGANYGYHPEPSKTVLVVDPSAVQQASELFADVGFRIVSGRQFLGGFISDDS